MISCRKAVFLIVSSASVYASCLHSPVYSADFELTGFTGAFAPSEWTPTTTGNASFTPAPTATDLTLVIPSTAASASSATFSYDTSKLAAAYPGISTGIVKFNWSWTSPTAGSTPYFGGNLSYKSGSLAEVTLTKYVGPDPAIFPNDYLIPTNFITSGTNVSFGFNVGDTIFFKLASNFPSTGSTAIVSSFTFDGYKPSVSAPAPLPILGVLAAFAYGRRIRRRLKVGTDNTGL